MCQSNLYSVGGGPDELLLEEVARLKVEGDRLTAEPLVGEPLRLTARIKEIDLMQHRIAVEKVPSGPP